ncbi:MAG: hypothetical protein US69_C0003G0029 [candidate division TM6 bacterium GW2011_GWF2_38_10]|nr:MAG: hypothetical protein US69_C0003G0029 [candidate division TM6 bacterium GW2011_GWF2_38_10]
MFFKSTSKWSDKITSYLQIDKHEKTKLICLSIAFLFIIGSYSILRSLKTSVFLGFVGKEYQPIAKIMSIILMFPAMLLYSKIIDSLRRYQVVYFFLALYAIIGFTFAFIFKHPVYGVQNTTPSIYRITGWAFEFFMDFYQAFVVSSFWSFINSISTPDFANKSYGIIYAVSRIGGILTTSIGLLILSSSRVKEEASIPLLTIMASIFLLGAAVAIWRIIKTIPHDQLYGYSDAHTFKKPAKKKPNVLEGLKLILTEPYVFGIFGLVACYEITNIIFDYQMQVLMSIETNNNIHAMSKFMLFYTQSFQILSFIFALFGTTTLLKKIGASKCLLIMPVVTLGLALWLLHNPSLTTVFIVMVALRGLQYGFNSPVREVLYIPTVKDIQFKSKAWIDSFGRTFSKSSGSIINLLSIIQKASALLSFQAVFVFAISSVWLLVSLFVGKTYQKTIDTDGLIGNNQPHEDAPTNNIST